MKKSVFIISIIIFAAISLTIARAVLSNVLSTTGVEIDKITNEVEFYKTENMLLKEELYNKESLHNIASKAAELGFAENRTQLVVDPTTSVLTRALSGE